jgi:hypothetical protein
MKIVSDLVSSEPIPKMVRVRQHFDDACIKDSDLPATMRTELDKLSGAIHPGMSVAVTCGSRGIHAYATLIRTAIDFLKEKGAKPFLVAAMGSHGGATEEGQRQVLESYGITAEAMGCPLHCEMETVEIGRSILRGQSVRIDKNAAEADGILLLNRIKPHTTYRGKYESGLMKMMAIGLGKQVGASALHSQNHKYMHELVEEYGKTILQNCAILGGVAIVENPYDNIYSITGLTPEQIITEEPKLRDKAYETIAKLPFDRCDVLVVDKIGKNISGEGMDPNVSGRFCSKYATGGIDAEKVIVLDLTDETHGNAHGIGLADATTRRLYEKMSMEMTYPTGITNTFIHLMKIPMVMDNDREAIQVGLCTLQDAEDMERKKLIRIPDTAHLEYLEVSEGLLPQVRANPRLEILSEPYEFPFDERGNLF